MHKYIVVPLSFPFSRNSFLRSLFLLLQSHHIRTHRTVVSRCSLRQHIYLLSLAFHMIYKHYTLSISYHHSWHNHFLPKLPHKTKQRNHQILLYHNCHQRSSFQSWNHIEVRKIDWTRSCLCIWFLATHNLIPFIYFCIPHLYQHYPH